MSLATPSKDLSISLKGRIGDDRFIGVNQLVQKHTGTKISGDGIANRHGLLTLYRVFTRNHLYGSAYEWTERVMTVVDNSVVMRWAATAARPFALQARYSFPKANEVELEVTIEAKTELVDFEVQVASYFDATFPQASVWTDDVGGSLAPPSSRCADSM